MYFFLLSKPSASVSISQQYDMLLSWQHMQIYITPYNRNMKKTKGKTKVLAKSVPVRTSPTTTPLRNSPGSFRSARSVSSRDSFASARSPSPRKGGAKKK